MSDGAPAKNPPVSHPNNFGAIRHILAIMVVLQHAIHLSEGSAARDPLIRLTGTFGSGAAALFGFFALSGYLITQSWARRPKLGSFLRNRALRIYPGYLVASTIAIFVVGRLGADVADYYHRLSPVHVVKCLVFFVIPENFPSFGAQKVPGNLDGAVWTIAGEVACYLFVAGAGATRLLRRSIAWPALLLISLVFGAQDVARLISPVIHPPYAQFFGGLALLLPSFLGGMCFYLFQDRLQFTPGRILLMAGVLGVAVFHKELALAGYATAGSYLLFAVGFADLPWLRGLGQRTDLSYGIYLYHWPVQQLLLRFVPGLGPVSLFPLSLAVASAAAWLSWHLVERPCLRMKSATKAPTSAPG